MQERQQPETLRFRAVMPALTVDDLEKSLAWYRDVAGFTVADVMRAEDRLVGATVQAGACQFLLAQDDFEKGRDRNKGVGFRLYCTTRQDIDVLALGIEARGGILDHQPTDQPWGARDFAIVDPDGFKISISTGLSSEG